MHRPNRAQPPLFTKGGDEDEHGGEGGRRHPDGRGDGWRKGTCVFFILAFDSQVMAAGEVQLEELVVRLRAQGVHSTHYIMVRLELR